MTEEEDKDQSVNDAQAQETPSEPESEHTPPQADSAEADTPSEVDSRGVDWENVAREYQRKYEEAQQRQYQPAKPEAPSQAQPNQVDPEKEVAEFAKNPKQYLDAYYQRIRYQEKLDSATELLKQNKMSVAEADTVIAEYGISTADPVKAVKAVMRIKKLSSQPKPTKPTKDDEQARIQKIKKNTVETKSTPAPPRPKMSDALLEQYKKSGSPKDLEAYYRQQLEE